MTRTGKRWLLHGLSYLFLAAVGASMVFPLLWMLITSVKSPGADVMDLTDLLPTAPTQIAPHDVRDWQRLCTRLHREGTGHAPGPSRRIWELLSEKDRDVIVEASTQPELDEEDKANLAVILNELIGRPDLYRRADFARLNLPDEVRKNLDRPAASPPREDVRKRNRLLLDRSYPQEITASHRLYWENFQTVLVETNFARALFNSVFVTVAVTVGQVVTSSLAAFAFARLKFFGRDKLFLAYLATMMIPGAVTMIPVFILLREFGWIDSYKALIIPAMFTAYGTFMLRQFFMSVPAELEEAAVMDGGSALRIYWNIVMPLSKPGIAALALLVFMGCWRSFMWPLIVCHTEKMYTVPVALAQFQEIYGVQWTLLMAGSVIMIIPMLVVFIFGQRYFVEGIRVGAVKG